jgi:Protein of unknown function (DUF3089)
MKDMQVTCLSRSATKHQVSRFAAVAGGLLAVTLLTAACSSPATSPVSSASSAATSPASSGQASATSTVWLCKPGMPDDPCINSLATTAVTATGATSVSSPKPTTSTTFACFYVYGTVSQEPSVNADLRQGKAEITAAEEQATPFSPVCQVYAPIYRQVTVADLATHPDLNLGPAETVTAYDSIKAGFEDFLTHELDGRPFVVIGDSQGAAMLDMLLARLVDDVPALRSRLVTAIILGGNVEVPAGQLVGGTFKHIPACSQLGETGCVIAYSSFPSTPPADSLFGRPGQGVSLQSGQTAKQGLQVVCVNPAALSGGSATLGAVFPSLLQAASTPWVSYPGLYTARCEQSDGATWLNVTKATGPADHRPTVTEDLGPDWGYHVWDLGLAQDNLVTDVASAEITWTQDHR